MRNTSTAPLQYSNENNSIHYCNYLLLYENLNKRTIQFSNIGMYEYIEIHNCSNTKIQKNPNLNN
jgi:hypothetical protein